MIFNGGLFRRLIGGYTIYYALFLIPDVVFLFGKNGMINYDSLPRIGPSLFYYLNSPSVIWASITLIIFLSLRLYRGSLSVIGLTVLYVLLISFWNANPYVIHEPHQIHSFFILTLFFWSLNDANKLDPFIGKLPCIFLCIYYFFAGLKKLPDLAWLNGDALMSVVHWGAVSRFSLNLGDNIWLVGLFKSATWLTALFELTFFLFAMTRWRIHLLLFGFFFHLMIKIFLDVGNFSEIMLVWYGACLRPADIEQLKTIFNRFKKLAIKAPA